MAFSTGTFVLSCLESGLPPAATSLASAADAANLVGSGTRSSAGLSSGFACGFLPVALVTTTAVKLLKKLLASLFDERRCQLLSESPNMIAF